MARPLEIRLERAGMDLEARQKQRRRLFQPDHPLVPERIALGVAEDGRPVLLWQWHDKRRAAERLGKLEEGDETVLGLEKRDDHDILRAFSRLADGELRPERFLRFAGRYGPFELCETHELPVGHPPVAEVVAEPCFPYSAHVPDAPGEQFWMTPLDLWYRYAREIRAALSIAAELHGERPGSREDWDILYPPLCRALGVKPEAIPRIRWMGDVAYEKHYLALLIDHWIEVSGLRPVFSWGPDPAVEPAENVWPDIGLGAGWVGNGVFAAVVRQLVFAVARVGQLRICAGCGKPFIPRRAWKWCRECGKKAADREAQRRRRAALKNRKED